MSNYSLFFSYEFLELVVSIKETFIMVSISGIVGLFLGLLIGTLLFFSSNKKLMKNKYVYYIFNATINIIRSIPFLIFVVLLIPFTRLIIGTGFGVYAAAFPMSFVSTALYSRFVEQSFLDIDPKIIDTAISMKATKFQIFRYFLIVEASHSLVLGFTSVLISLISYSTVMGVIGGGGIGDYAMRHGYYEYNYELIYLAIIILMIIVFAIQFIGNKISNNLNKRGWF